MEKRVILSLSENTGFGRAKAQTRELDTVIMETIQGRKRAVKRIMKLYRGKDILLSKKDENDGIFTDVKKERNSFRQDSVLPVINEICKQASRRFFCNIPFEEIYIVAEENFALKIIEKIKDMARMFVVVSEEESKIKLYDKLYFEHSAIARHRKTMPSAILEDSMIICFKDSSFDREYKSPFINFTSVKTNLCKEVNGRKICVSDSNIRKVEKLWGGRSGFTLFEFFGIETGEDSIVDINNCADDIFLLDTAAF